MRLRVASCSKARRRVDVSVVVVTLRTCEACDPDLLSPEVFRVAVLAGRDCCWRRAAEARLSATEAPREGGLEAIARVVHSKRSVSLFAVRSRRKRQYCYSSSVNIFSSASCSRIAEYQLRSLITHSFVDCGDRVQAKQKGASCAQAYAQSGLAQRAASLELDDTAALPGVLHIHQRRLEQHPSPSTQSPPILLPHSPLQSKHRQKALSDLP